jgi:uncharacterized protein DUF4953/uncharacterized protein DUF5117
MRTPVSIVPFLLLTVLLLCALAAGCASAGSPAGSAEPAGTGAPAKEASSAAEPAPSKSGEALPTLAEKTAGLEKKDGLLPIYLDRRRGKVWLEVPAAAGPGGEVASFLYVEGLLTGLGSNPVGLDRGQLSDARILTLRRVGGRVLFEQPNLRFRALSEDPRERQTVRESFATSVLWAGEIAAEGPDGRALVDLTPFLVRDAHDVVTTIRKAGQGSFSLDPARSAVDLDACLAFPENLEFEAVLTYQSSDPGALVVETAPTGGAVTLVEHQSLLKLPDPGYRPRAADPRAGFFGVRFLDYAAPLAAPIETRWIARHRLEKTDPAAARSPVKKPIVYYVDPGTPEPVRSALLEGASWWKEAFEKAGFVDAYRVELLPPGAHPLDARYNVIQWVHRSTRGWSYGGGVIDPRTGEIVKGHVTLGSLRVRQDRLIFEGLLGTDKSGSGAPDDPVAIALARIRQLAAHEVGHSLGLEHNFAASTYGRASVMDYPAPLVKVTPHGDLDLSAAYATGMGEWDVQAIRYAYSEFPPGTDETAEAAALDGIVREGLAHGRIFLTDQDARPEGAAQPLANLWDNGADPVEGLEQALAVRRVALARFGERNIARGRPFALLQEVLAPIYLFHRYQLDAAAKAVGGLEYSYALRGDGQPASRPVPAAEQRRAIRAIAGLLQPAALDLPEDLLALLLPRPADYDDNPELFGSRTAPVFDALGAAATAADMAARALLQPQRAARLVDFHRRDPKLPGLEEVLDAVVGEAFSGAPRRGEAATGGSAGGEAAHGGSMRDRTSPRMAELRRTVQSTVVGDMIRLARDPGATPGVRARVEGRLATLAETLKRAPGATGEEAAHRAYLRREIDRFLERRSDDTAPPPAPPAPPPGQPIGEVPGLGGCSQDG